MLIIKKLLVKYHIFFKTAPLSVIISISKLYYCALRRIGDYQMKKKMSKSSIVFFIAAAFVAVVGTALLVNNVLLYNDNVTMYVSQGYSVETVTAQLLPAQLIPGVLEPIGTMYGIAFALAAAGVINNKLSSLLGQSEAAPVNVATEAVEAEVPAAAETAEDVKEEAVAEEAAEETAESGEEKKEEDTKAV
jgi:hypothetical protein